MGSNAKEVLRPAEAGTRSMEVYVLFTDIPATLGALRTAAQLVQGLTARIRLLLVDTVPYPLPLESPRRNTCFLVRQLRTVMGSSSVMAEAEVLLCRDAFDTIRQRLPQESAIVIGRRRGWWPRSEDRLARKLRSAGHDVVRTSGAHA